MQKKLLNVLFIVLLLSLITNTTTASADEVSGHGHEAGLRYLIAKNALDKDSNGNYSINRTVTRGEFAAYLSRVLDLKGGESFTFPDVTSKHPYAVDIKRAAAAGLITGYTTADNTFRPDNPISRQHMAIMLDRVMDHLKFKKVNKELTFKDAHLIADPYKQAVAFGAALEIIQGDNGYFMPLKNATVAQSASFIHRLMELTGDPQADIPIYTVKEISNGTLIGNQTFMDYSDAENAIKKNSQVIVLKDKIVKMNAGFVVTNKYVALYSETLKDQMAVAANTEMEYLGSDGTNIRVRLAGQVGNLKIADVTLVPFSMTKGRSYYENYNGEIRHVLHNHATGTGAGNYTYGKAPAFMNKGEKYYSWNGINFNNANGTTAGVAYNYYQFLPARSKTNYSADEIDRHILKNAPPKSKLIGLGKTLKDLEAKYQINALLILALAQHESAYGMSNHAQTNNNLFGLYVYDTNPLNKKFVSIEANIDELINEFLQPKYISPVKSITNKTGHYPNGAVVGSNAVGFNVKYASDPYWGAKIAGHYYRADKDMGFKDAKNPYTIGFTTTTGLNVRTVPTTINNKELFKYANSGMPVIITGSPSNDWYEILSDQLHTTPVYVSKQYVRVIETVK